jgi:hypothetical protein
LSRRGKKEDKPSSVSGEFKDLSDEVLEDGGEVDW